MATKKSTSIIIALVGFSLITVIYIGKYSDSNGTGIRRFSRQLLFDSTNVPLSRVLCLILTSPASFSTRAKAVNDTWAPRCDKYFFISEVDNANLTAEQKLYATQLPIAPIPNITIGYDHLTEKTNKAFMYAFENYYNHFDWFVKADDDTYLMVHNLKSFLQKQKPEDPITFGFNFKVYVPKGYHSGGASYVLSREALRRLHEAHTEVNSTCKKDGGAEDVEIATCLRTRGVFPGKSLDKYGREMFHPLPFIDHFRGKLPDWLHSFAENPLRKGYNCCSDESISFHYVSPDEQYIIDFFLYKAKHAVFQQTPLTVNNRSNETLQPVK